MDYIKLTNEKLSIEEVNDKVTAANCGAISLFVGTTRDNFEDKTVVTLEYEAYEPMANKAMKEICTEIRDKWKDVKNIAIYHRLGRVPVTEASVIIAVSSPHRSTALEATSHCIEALKKSVPIWKKEVYADDAAEPAWKENSECAWSKNKSSLKPRTDNIVDVPSHLIQITCSKEEMRRRIETFMAFKREQANRTNIRDFCGSVEDSCARVAARLKRHTNSKSHLRMQRVYNAAGPYSGEKSKAPPYISSAVEGRVKGLELSLGLTEKPVSPDIYQRLRAIEDRILFLESVSPEYKHFWNTDFMDFRVENKDENVNSVKKKKYDIHDVDSLLYELEKEAGTKS